MYAAADGVTTTMNSSCPVTVGAAVVYISVGSAARRCRSLRDVLHQPTSPLLLMPMPSMNPMPWYHRLGCPSQSASASAEMCHPWQSRGDMPACGPLPLDISPTCLMARCWVWTSVPLSRLTMTISTGHPVAVMLSGVNVSTPVKR